MDSKPASKPELPESPEAQVNLVKSLLDSAAFQIAEERFKERLFNAWISSSPTAKEDRENLYHVAKSFDGLKHELRTILDNANTELAKRENTRRQRDMDSWPG